MSDSPAVIRSNSSSSGAITSVPTNLLKEPNNSDIRKAINGSEV